MGCRYHLYLDVNILSGSVKFNFPEKDVLEMEQTCALDVAEVNGGATLEEIGGFLNVSRERVRQIETSVNHKMKALLRFLLDRL